MEPNEHPQTPQEFHQEIQRQFDKSTGNPMPIVAALLVAAGIVLGILLLTNPQGIQTASFHAPDSAPAHNQAQDKTEPEK